MGPLKHVNLCVRSLNGNKARIVPPGTRRGGREMQGAEMKDEPHTLSKTMEREDYVVVVVFLWII